MITLKSPGFYNDYVRPFTVSEVVIGSPLPSQGSVINGFQTLISTRSLVALAVARVITKSLCRSIPTSGCLPWTRVTIRESPLQAEAQAASACRGGLFRAAPKELVKTRS